MPANPALELNDVLDGASSQLVKLEVLHDKAVYVVARHRVALRRVSVICAETVQLGVEVFHQLDGGKMPASNPAASKWATVHGQSAPLNLELNMLGWIRVSLRRWLHDGSGSYDWMANVDSAEARIRLTWVPLSLQNGVYEPLRPGVAVEL